MVQHSDIDHSGLTGVPSSNPQFTTIELGHASDTTIARASAGNLTVEGNALYRAGGTDVALADGGTGASLADPNADRLLFWDDSAGSMAFLTAGTGLTITGTTIEASGGGGGVTRSTAGTTSVGGSWETARGLYVKKITLATAGLLSGISAHVKGDGSNAGSVTAAMYSDSAGSPINILHAPVTHTAVPGRTFTSTMNTTGRWLAFPVGVWLTAADYWIGVLLTSDADSRVQLAYAASGSDKTVGVASINQILDSSIQAFSNTTRDYSIYADIIR